MAKNLAQKPNKWKDYIFEAKRIHKIKMLADNNSYIITWEIIPA